MIPISRLAVTGASGWLGTELLELLTLHWGSDAVKENVQCFGSFERSTSLSDGTTIAIRTLVSANLNEPVDGVVHLGFQTRDKVTKLGLDKYLSTNSQITSSALQLIEATTPKWVATVSSGAVYKSPTSNKLEDDAVKNPYGFGKHMEETILREICDEGNINLSIGRLWGAGGLHMPVNNAYALSDFITSALKNQTIHVRAPHLVTRRYCDAGNFMELLVSRAFNHRLSIFNSGGEAIELGKLANVIADKTGAAVTREQMNESLPVDSYYPKDHAYEDFLQAGKITPSTLEQLIEATIKGHQLQASKA